MNNNILTGLSPKMIEAYQTIKALQLSLGRSPNYSELQTALGLRSKSGISRLVASLEARGYLRRHHNRSYGIIVLDQPASAPPPLRPQTQAALDAYCRLHGENRDDVINDAVALFVDQAEADLTHQVAEVAPS